jgi:hypothetical protein
MMSFTAGVFLGGIVGGSLGLVIATLMVGQGRASEDERVHEAYKSGLDEGSSSKVGQVMHPSYAIGSPNEARMIRHWLNDWNVKLSPWQKEKLDEIARQIDERDDLQQVN